MPKPFLLVNPRSGGGDGTPSLLAEAAARGIDARALPAGDELPEAPVLGVAGGDGTLGAVARVALERGVPFVCVPFGTRNHFARDLGLDVDDPVRVLDAFADGAARVVDVGRVGDRVFLNNVSIGAYASYVHGRLLLRRHRLVIDGAPVEGRVVLFANNAYRLDARRDRLDAGELHLYVAHGLLRRAWDERVGSRFVVDGVREVAVDGEAVRVDAPFEVAIEPQALTVLVPRERE